MSEEPVKEPQSPEIFELEYVDSQDCVTKVASGAVFSRLVEDANMYQLSFFIDANRLGPERLRLQKAAEGHAIYEKQAGATSVPYREVFVRVLLTPSTLARLAELLAKQNSPEKLGGEHGS